jgi:hypothetical protein
MKLSTWGKPRTVLTSIPEELEMEPVESQYFTVQEKDWDFDKVGNVREESSIRLKKYHRMLLTTGGKEAIANATKVRKELDRREDKFKSARGATIPRLSTIEGAIAA